MVHIWNKNSESDKKVKIIGIKIKLNDILVIPRGGKKLMTNKKKFEDFYYNSECSSERKICPIEEISNYIEKNNDYNVYDGHMFCPECRQAELAYVHETTRHRAFLRTKPSTSHMEGCSYNYEYAKKKQIEEFVESLDDNQIRDRLNSALNMLNRDTNPSRTFDQSRNIGNSIEDNPFLIQRTGSTNSNPTAIRRKRLSTYIDKKLGTHLYLFYGDVRIEVESKLSKNNNSYYRLTIKAQNKQQEWTYRTNIMQYKLPEQSIDPNDTYQIAFIGTYNKKYKNIDLINNNAISYRQKKDSSS